MCTDHWCVNRNGCWIFGFRTEMENERARNHGFRDAKCLPMACRSYFFKKPNDSAAISEQNTENRDVEEKQHLKAERRRARAIGF